MVSSTSGWILLFLLFRGGPSYNETPMEVFGLQGLRVLSEAKTHMGSFLDVDPFSASTKPPYSESLHYSLVAEP